MEPLETVRHARTLLEDVTPLKHDCGRYCGGACCGADEDGQGGMLLFPGEEMLYPVLPEGWLIVRDDGVLPDMRLLICDGRCRRNERPLACRLFPLLPAREGSALDQRAWAVCPLMAHGKAGLDPAFVRAVEAAGAALYESAPCARLLDALHAYNRRLREL